MCCEGGEGMVFRAPCSETQRYQSCRMATPPTTSYCSNSSAKQTYHREDHTTALAGLAGPECLVLRAITSVYALECRVKIFHGHTRPIQDLLHNSEKSENGLL